jgi:hypothetical protein
LDRRTSGPVPPNAELGLNVSLETLKSKRKQLALVIASWWLDDLGALIRVEFEKSDFLVVRLAAHSKAGATEILMNNYSNRDFFGNFLPLMELLVQKLRFTTKYQKKAKFQERRRGYTDHGSLRPSTHWRPKSDWSFDEVQNELERVRAESEDTYQFLLGFMGLT